MDLTFDEALKAIPAGPVIILAHTLGSMIAYKNLMNVLLINDERQKGRSIYVITMGSLLAHSNVQRALLGSHARFPAPVRPP